MRVNKSTVIDAPIRSVWQVLRDFNSHGDWHPAIADSQIDHNRPADAVSAVRTFHLEDGAELKEQLLSLSDQNYSLRYCLTETPVPLQNYVAEVSLKPITDTDRTYWQWQSKFDTPPGQEQELKSLVEEQIYQAGFNAIKTLLGRANHPVSFAREPAIAASRHQPSGSTGSPARYYSLDNSESVGDSKPVIADLNNDVQSALESSNNTIEAPAIIIHEHGGPEVLRYQSMTLPPPAAREVRIQHRAIGVNYIDVYCRTGYFNFVQPPGGLGMEAAGEIIGVGSSVSRFKPGDRVAYAAPPVGAYSVVRNIDQDALIKIPSRMTFKTAAAMMLKGMTAEFLLHRVYALKEGDTILIHAVAGGVGTLLCQWAKTKGATIIGTVSTAEKAAFAASNGCHYPVLYTEENFVDRVKEITRGEGVDAVFDAIGRQTFGDSVQCIRPGGHVISFGQAGEPLGEWDLGQFAAQSLTLSRPNFGHYTDTPEKISSICNNLFHAWENGIIQVHIGQEFPLSNAAAAHQALQDRRTTGSTILIPEAEIKELQQ